MAGVRLRLLAILSCGLLVQSIAAQAAVVVSWVQLGPGSSAPTNTSYGDLPTSLTATVLVRAVVDNGACPAATLSDGSPLTLATRVTAAQLTNTPGNAGATNAPTAVGGTYPQYFVKSTQTAPANFPDGTAMVTTSWAECEAVVPTGHASAKTVSVSGFGTLKLPVAKPQRILVIGDIGCRMAATAQQDCHNTGLAPNVPPFNTPSIFPFGKLASYEAQFAPDLVVEVGDYFYRDTNCVTATVTKTAAGGETTNGGEWVPGCSNPNSANYETWGDTWDSWNADVFYPGKNLLAAAPWVMARGNHESCGRGARGWFALLDPEPFNASFVTCALNAGKAAVTNAAVYSGDFRPTYIVPVGPNLNLLVHDSSFATDASVDTNMAANYDYDMSNLLKNYVPSNSYNIFVTHKPTYGLASGAPTNSGDFTEQYAFSGKATAGSAFAGGVPLTVALFLSGHIHQFEYVNFNSWNTIAPQLIVGVGGSTMDPTANPNPADNLAKYPGADPIYSYASELFTVHNGAAGAATTTTVQKAYSQAEFGFAVLDTTSTGFIANVYNIYANKAGQCTITLNPRGIKCWD